MLKHVIVIVALLAGFLLLARRMVSPSLYGYDESDYVFVSELGLVANYTDTPTLPITDFVREGLGRGRAADQHSAISESIRATNDVIFYRHWHGPLYFYWLIVDSELAHDEGSMRMFSLIIPILSFFVIYFGCLWLSPGTAGWLAAILCSAMFLFSWTTLGSPELAPHHLFATCSLLGLFLLAQMVATGERRYLLLSSFVAGLAFCTMELTFGLVATAIVCAFLERRRLQLDWKLAFKSVLIFVGTVLVVWPGAILKVSFAKAYMFMAYLALFRKSPWGNEGLLETWWDRFLFSPVEWIMIAAGIALYFTDREIRSKRFLYPFLVIAGIMILATLRVTTSTARYGLVFIPALQVCSGLVIATWLLRKGMTTAYVAASVLCVALFAAGYRQVSKNIPGTDQRLASILNLIRENRATTGTLLVPQGYVPALHYYIRDAHLRGYYGEVPTPAELSARDLTGVLFGADTAPRFEPLPAR